MYRILSLDGGSIRGLVTAILLQRLDKAVPGWRDSIDLVAGTSTGGILALGLAHGMTPTQLRALYEHRGRKIFDDSWLDDLRDLGQIMGAEYDNDNLAAELKKAFGKARLRDLRKNVLVPTFDLDKHTSIGRTWEPKLFHNFPGADTDGNTLVWKVALYTSAAPTYFPSVDGYIDGGVYANNPSLCALVQTQDRRSVKATPAWSDIRLLSLGTGTSLTYIEGDKLDWGYAQWVKPLINVLMDGVSGIADFQCAQLLGGRYLRVAPVFPRGKVVALDDVGRIPELVAFASRVDLRPAIRWLDETWA
ncbi:MAG: patatin-like phospholipase family protein [Nevskiaceae bacterium]